MEHDRVLMPDGSWVVVTPANIDRCKKTGVCRVREYSSNIHPSMENGANNVQDHKSVT